MVWLALLAALWISAFVLVIALAHVAARSDQPTAEHLARITPTHGWLAPQHPDARHGTLLRD